MKRHVWATPLSTEDYLSKEVSKNTKLQMNDIFIEFTDQFALLDHHECLSNIETEGKDISQKSIQHQKCTN